MRRSSAFALVLLIALSVTGCRAKDDTAADVPPTDLRIFHAAGMTPVLDAVRDDCLRDLNIRLQTEASGSQAACYKLTQMGRSCDLLMLADAALVPQLLDGWCAWRIDFAGDEIVIGVGARAPHVSEAEEDWTSALLRDDVRLGRVNEDLGPIGYRTLLAWRLQERRGSAGLYDALMKRCEKVVDHVTRLTPLLKIGDLDYGFVYRSICVARDIRTIALPPEINLGAQDMDYSAATVVYKKRTSEGERTIRVTGAPITWTLTVPDRDADAGTARRFILWLLGEKRDVLERNGFRPMAPPRFVGPAEAAAPFHAILRPAEDAE